MAIFANSAATQTTASVANTATQIYNTSASGIPTGAVIGDIIVENTGTVTFFLGQSAVTAVTGLRVPPGAQVVIVGFGSTQGSANFNLYAITASGTSSAMVGPATVDAAV